MGEKNVFLSAELWGQKKSEVKFIFQSGLESFLYHRKGFWSREEKNIYLKSYFYLQISEPEVIIQTFSQKENQNSDI